MTSFITCVKLFISSVEEAIKCGLETSIRKNICVTLRSVTGVTEQEAPFDDINCIGQGTLCKNPKSIVELEQLHTTTQRHYKI